MEYLIEFLPGLMFLALIVGLFSSLPVAVMLMGVTLIFGVIALGIGEIRFAQITLIPNRIYGGIIASGFQTLIVAFDLILNANIWTDASMGSPGLDELRWKLPVRPGDTLRVRGRVTASEPSASRPDRGRTTIEYEIVNQKGEIVSSYSAVQLLKRR